MALKRNQSGPLALLIGSNGQDGVLLARLLQAEGWRVAAMGRRAVVLPDGNEKHGVDITNGASIGQLIASLKPDHIYYLAAYNGSTERRSQISYVDSVAGCLSVNLSGFANVLSGASVATPDARVLYAASSHAFGVPDHSPQTEATALRPLTPYGITKAAGIRLCASYRDSLDMFVASAILYNHESPLRSDDYVTQKIASAAAKAATGGDGRITIRNLEARVDWGSAEDYVRAMRLILQQDRADDYIVASGTAHSVAEFADLAYAHVGLNWKDYVSQDADAPPPLVGRNDLVGDTTKLRQRTGWSPRISFDEMVASLVDAARERLR